MSDQDLSRTEEYIRQLVAQAPPLSAEQRARLAEILRETKAHRP